MKLTTNYNLKKPEGGDTVNIEDFNYNSDIIDNEFNVINTKLDEALQLGVNAKDNVVQAINSKKTVPNVTNENNWEFLSQSIRNIKEGSGNAVASDVLAGKTFTNNDGVEYTGTMVNRGGATTVTPKTSNQTKAAGYYSGAITIKGDSNLVASNILSGKSIFGVKGNVVAGMRWASGTAPVTVDTSSNSASHSWVQVTGLAFTPNLVILTLANSSAYYCAEYALSMRSGHSLLSNTSIFKAGRDYVMYTVDEEWYRDYTNTGTMITYNYYQMGTNSFRIPISFESGYGANMKYNWYAIE